MLPIESVLPQLLAALREDGAVVLQAPPGAGKTTRVPLALLDQPWRRDGTILVLEPRRLAARASAQRMAAILGETVGETVGYRVRLDSRVGPKTRIEVVTEGLYLRRLQDDPGLDGVAAVLFDEFHERHLDSDLALALTLETRQVLREDLRLIIMSATLDGGPIARLLNGAPLIVSEGRSYPVETSYWPCPDARRMELWVASCVRRALTEDIGDILVFLPGGREIRRVQRLLSDANATVLPLYGDLPHDQQDLALGHETENQIGSAAPRVVLATPIAETSLTIAGIRLVIDSGLMRAPRFDPRSGMTRLETEKVSQASADQRKGRAGRLGPGLCWRLWPEPTHKALAAFNTPEILAADLAPLALELAVWGAAASDLKWLDPPPAGPLAQASTLLTGLDALDRAGSVTPHGRQMSAMGTHPRLAHMMLIGRRMGAGSLACILAALLGERDPLKASAGPREADLRQRIAVLAGEGRERRENPRRADTDIVATKTIRDLARQWQRHLRVPTAIDSPSPTGPLVALAYPDRIAQRRPGGSAQYKLSSGRGAVLDDTDPLAREPYLAVASADGDRRQARIFLAAPITQDELEQLFADHLETTDTIAWDPGEKAVAARRQRRLFALVLTEKPLSDPDPDLVAKALLNGVLSEGVAALPWTASLLGLRQRVAFLNRLEPAEGWPDLSDDALTATLDHWLLPHLAGTSKLSAISAQTLSDAIAGLLPWPLPKRLDENAPTHLVVPSGSRIALDYSSVEGPILSVKLQEMFGTTATPTIVGGRVPVTLHLLSPAQRPVQVTRDLAGFWAGSYREVKADLKGRYPRHPWPDDPAAASPTRRAKQRVS